jgi:hypothetical protein
MSKTMCRALRLMVLCSLVAVAPAAADLKGEAFDRFYSRYTGVWKVNVAKSRYIVGEPPKEGPSHTYSPIPGRNGIKYNNDTVHLFDGREHPISSKQPGSTVVRDVLDEFTVSNVLRTNGRITSRNTLVLSPDGKSAVIVFINIDEQGRPTIRSLVHYDKVQPQ